MLQPSRQKYRKMQKGRNKGIATTGNKVSFGDFGLKAIGASFNSCQIEAARRVMTLTLSVRSCVDPYFPRSTNL